MEEVKKNSSLKLQKENQTQQFFSMNPVLPNCKHKSGYHYR